MQQQHLVFKVKVSVFFKQKNVKILYSEKKRGGVIFLIFLRRAHESNHDWTMINFLLKMWQIIWVST